jgi:hypothetical protein
MLAPAPVQDAHLLAQHFNIQLAGVLDTQVLAGWAALGEAALRAADQLPASSRHLSRIGLGKLCAMHGLPHPGKEAMQGEFAADPRWAGAK